MNPPGRSGDSFHFPLGDFQLNVEFTDNDSVTSGPDMIRIEDWPRDAEQPTHFEFGSLAKYPLGRLEFLPQFVQS